MKNSSAHPTAPVVLLAVLACTLSSPSAAQVSQDVTPPVLTDFTFSPMAVNTSTGTATVTVTMQITDDISGVSFGNALFSSPSGNQHASTSCGGSQQLTSGTDLNGSWQCQMTLANFSEAGVWILSDVQVVDNVKNTRYYYTSDLQALGFPTQLQVTSTQDVTPPVLTGFAFTPMAVNTSTGTATVTVRMQITDDISGVSFGNALFSSPSGNQHASTSCGGSQQLTSGTDLNGSWQCQMTLANFSEAGVWILSDVQVVDNVKNTRYYYTSDLQALGFPTQLINGVISGLTITTSATLPAGAVGTSYSQSLAASGGTPPYSWSLISGALPAGLSLSTSGAITGTPTVVGSLSFAVRVTDAASSQATLTFGLTIGPASQCAFTLNLSGLSFPAQGGTGTVIITTASGCRWTVGNIPAGITLTGSASGSGSGTVTLLVSPNSGGYLSEIFTIAGQTFTIDQQAASVPGMILIGSMPHIAAEENWITTFILVNKGTASAEAQLSFSGDLNDPSGNGPLPLPLVFTQQGGPSGPLLAASFDQTLAANASLMVTTGGPQTPPVLVGSAQLSATGAVDGFAIFHQIVTTQEAVVPMQTRNAPSYLLAFDNTNGLVLGVALDNVSAASAVIPVVIRDENGVVISASGTSISLGGNAHISFVLSDAALGFPVTANIRGTIEFDTTTGGQISVLGLRFTPPNNALTTIPALANVGTDGGSIAHLASGGDGWQTTFVLVNTGTSAAQFTLSFFNDQTGAPLSLPFTSPQLGGGQGVASSVTQILTAGATRVIVSAGAENLLTGSAQLTTAGNISGFVIFRHNNQEAVVPLENRNAGGYIIAYDNTNGTATGIAVNAVSSGRTNIPVTVRDSTGATIASDTITLNPNGHYAFTLVNDRYAVTANITGTIEFDAPTGAQIGALGIRIPTGAAHTFTTLPALSK